MTNNTITIKYVSGRGAQMGLIKSEAGYEFTCELSGGSTYLLIYDEAHGLFTRIDMTKYRINESLASVVVNDIPSEQFTYVYEVDGVAKKDLYSKNSTGKRKYREQLKNQDEFKLYVDDFNWEGDKPIRIPFDSVIAYQLHVRGFTAHASSKLKAHKGKFLGIVEKIPHLTDLGINQVILMPAYEFDELEISDSKEIRVQDYKKTEEEREINPKVNFWGFKTGQYYMPKAAYAEENSVDEFKMMVKKLHEAGIEVIMRFYFPDDFNVSIIPDILRFWVSEYHVDGFFVMGNHLPIEYISQDLFLRDTKIYVTYFDKYNILNNKVGYNRNMAIVNNDFSIVARKFLKSDENMLNDFLYRHRNNPSDVHVINYITDYEGFTLNDLVSFDHKHNEANGEDNRDGEDFNYSWNCGCEGATRKKSIVQLRQKQIKNALSMLLLAQGVPMLLAGDEMLNSQNGNNNPYCQDNEIGWVNWNNNNSSKQIYDFVKKLIKLRRTHPILRPNTEYRLMDYAACGFPDLSYHGDNAWAPRMDNYLRYIGIMLCGRYARIDRLNEDDFFYLAYNMHWEQHDFALPKLPKGYKWIIEMSTCDEPKSSDKEGVVLSDDEDYIKVCDRSVVVLRSVKNIRNEEVKI